VATQRSKALTAIRRDLRKRINERARALERSMKGEFTYNRSKRKKARPKRAAQSHRDDKDSLGSSGAPGATLNQSQAGPANGGGPGADSGSGNDA